MVKTNKIKKQLIIMLTIVHLFVIDVRASEPNLVFYGPLNSEETVEDNGGTIAGEVIFTEGKVENCANIIRGNIDFPYEGNFNPNAGTIQFLVEPNDSGSMGLLEVGRLGSKNSLGIFRFSKWGRTITALEIRRDDMTYPQAWNDKDEVRLENGQWYLVTAIWQCNQTPNDFFQLYINDVPGYRHQGSVCTEFLEPAQRHIRIGYTYWYGYGQGKYDELEIFDYPKTAEEIETDYCCYFVTPIIGKNADRISLLNKDQSKNIQIWNAACGTLSYELAVVEGSTYFGVSPTHGSSMGDDDKQIHTVTVDRDLIPPGRKVIGLLEISASEADNSPQYVHLSATTADIEFTYVPTCGSTENVEGRVINLDPNEYSNHKVAIYIFVSSVGWWNKPTFANPCTAIKSDGTWATRITTGGEDKMANMIFATLVSADCNIPLLNGAACLPQELFELPHVLAERNPVDCHRKIQWSGYTWWVKRSSGAIGPGPNFFSDSTDNVWVDLNGYLHLKITHRNNQWQCAEVVNSESFGHGIYSFKVRGGIEYLDPHVVLGLFTWDDYDYSCMHNNREIDIEMTRWSDPNNDNTQFVVQPSNNPGNMYRFNIVDANQPTIHRFTWMEDYILFQSLYQDEVSWPMNESILAEWLYTGEDNPVPGKENPRINLWLMDGLAPIDGQEAEMIIEKFEYIRP